MLLSKAEWDKEQFIRDLQEEWGIVDDGPEEDDEDDENSSDVVVMQVNGMMLVATLFYSHIPDSEQRLTPKTTICGQKP